MPHFQTDTLLTLSVHSIVSLGTLLQQLHHSLAGHHRIVNLRKGLSQHGMHGRKSNYGLLTICLQLQVGLFRH